MKHTLYTVAFWISLLGSAALWWLVLRMWLQLPLWIVLAVIACGVGVWGWLFHRPEPCE